MLKRMLLILALGGALVACGGGGTDGGAGNDGGAGSSPAASDALPSDGVMPSESMDMASPAAS